jgi:hypothetical protein
VCQILPGEEQVADPKHKAINMAPHSEVAASRKPSNFDFFLDLPQTLIANDLPHVNSIKNSQLLEPLFEFSAPVPAAVRRPTSS